MAKQNDEPNDSLLAELPAEPAPLPPDQALTLVRHLRREAEGIRALEAKKDRREEDLARVLLTVLETQENTDVEDAKATLKAARERALDVEEVHKAKKAVKVAREKLATVTCVREAKAIAKDVEQIEEATKERRRAVVQALFGGKPALPSRETGEPR